MDVVDKLFTDSVGGFRTVTYSYSWDKSFSYSSSDSDGIYSKDFSYFFNTKKFVVYNHTVILRII